MVATARPVELAVAVVGGQVELVKLSERLASWTQEA
jgi:hypothetical protein